MTDPEGNSTEYRLNPQGYLINVTDAKGNSSRLRYDAVSRLIETIDPQGQRSSQQSNLDQPLIVAANTTTEHYLINSQRNIIQISHSNNSTASTHIITGQGIDSHLATVQNNQTSYVHRDGLNSTTTTTDENGNITSISQYTPYGITSSTGNYPFQYTGCQPINDGLYYYRARYYDPVAGRFLSEDPIGLAGGGLIRMAMC